MLSRAAAVVFLITTIVFGYLLWDVKQGDGDSAGSKSVSHEPAAPFAGTEGEQQKRIEQHLRERLDMPSSVEIVVGEIKEGEIPGLQEGEVLYRRGGKEQKSRFYLSSDGNYLILGRVMDLTVDPRQEVLSKISMENVIVRGSKEAPVTIVEYSDLQCPFCARAHQTIEKLVADYEGKVKWVWKHFPLTAIHKWAEDAAVGMECVRQQKEEAAWEFAAYVFDHQREINQGNLDEKVSEFAREKGLNERKLKSCRKDEDVLEKVQADMEEGKAVGVGSTPTFYVNGHPLKGARPYAEFQAAVDEALGVDTSKGNETDAEAKVEEGVAEAG